MTEVYTINSRKGGTAKTTTIFEGADHLEQQGNCILVIDLDPSMSLTYRYIFESEIDQRLSKENTILNLFERDKPVKPIKVSTGIDLIAGNAELGSMSKTNKIIQGMGRRYLGYWFAKNKDWIEKHYDYILIDTHNDGSILVENAMIASDFIIIPIDVDGDSMRTVFEVEDHLERLRELELHPVTFETLVQAKTLKVGTRVGDAANSKRFKAAFQKLMTQDSSYLGWFKYSELIAKAKTENKPLSEFKKIPLYKSKNFSGFFKEIDDLFDRMFSKETRH